MISIEDVEAKAGCIYAELGGPSFLRSRQAKAILRALVEAVNEEFQSRDVSLEKIRTSKIIKPTKKEQDT